MPTEKRSERERKKEKSEGQQQAADSSVVIVLVVPFPFLVLFFFNTTLQCMHSLPRPNHTPTQTHIHKCQMRTPRGH